MMEVERNHIYIVCRERNGHPFGSLSDETFSLEDYFGPLERMDGGMDGLNMFFLSTEMYP